MKNFYQSDSFPSSKVLPARAKGVAILFAMVSATALGACSQSPAPIVQGNQVLNAPGSTLFDTASAPAVPSVRSTPPVSQSVEVAEIEPLPPVRRETGDWQEGSDTGLEPIAPPLKREPVVKRQPKLVQSQARVTDNMDIPPRPEPMAVRETIEVPRAKPRAPREVVVVVPRSQPNRTKPEPVDTQSFVDIPINTQKTTAEPATGNEVAVLTPSSQPEIAISKSKEVSFSWPVTGPVITRFGPTESGKRNEGINIAVREGARVRSAEAGTVAYVGNELTGYGNLLLVRHESGYVTAYAHNKDLLVKKGDQVQKGDVIALAGMSGSVDEPQLHFEVRKGVNAVDPMKFLGRPGARS